MDNLYNLNNLRKTLESLEARHLELRRLQAAVRGGVQSDFTLTSGDNKFVISRYDSRYYQYAMKEAYNMVKLGLIKGLDLEMGKIEDDLKAIKEEIAKELNHLKHSM